MRVAGGAHAAGDRPGAGGGGVQFRAGPKQQPLPSAASTCPLGSRVAVCCVRAVVILPVALQVSVAELCTSALLVMAAACSSPPANSTWPFCSAVVVYPVRAVPGLPVARHLPVAGLYSPALVRAPMLRPPITSTWPLASSVAVRLCRGWSCSRSW